MPHTWIIILLFAGILALLIEIRFSFYITIKNQNKMSQQLDNLTAKVTALSAACDSAVTLLGSLKTDLDAAILASQNGDNGTALDALSSTIDTETQKLTAAITANTPPASDAPAPEAAPAPEEPAA